MDLTGLPVSSKPSPSIRDYCVSVVRACTMMETHVRRGPDVESGIRCPPGDYKGVHPRFGGNRSVRTTRRRPATSTDSSPAGPEFEKRIRREATLGDLDLDLAGAFLKASPVGGESVLDSLQHYGLIRPQEDEDDWTVTNAALLLFARGAGRRWHPRAGLRVARVAGTQRLAGNQNVTDAALVHPPLACGIQESLRAAGTHVRRSEALRDIFFRDMPEYPDVAWREIIVNAIAIVTTPSRTRGRKSRFSTTGWRCPALADRYHPSQWKR